MDIEKLKCKECGQEFTKIDCVTRHAKMIHKMEPKAYTMINGLRKKAKVFVNAAARKQNTGILNTVIVNFVLVNVFGK